MKKMYWHAHNLPRIFIIGLCLIALVGMGLVEHYKKFVPQSNYKEKVAAAELAKQAFDVIQKRRHWLGIAINTDDDPQSSGLIGYRLTNVTTDQGNLSAKQTSVNPNIAAIFVDWLKQLGLKSGDVVAMGATGSFPALNICMLSAMHTLGLKPLIVYSIGASQYGANILGFMWLDMYHELEVKKIFDVKPLGVSLGGVDDRARGMKPSVRAALRHTIERYHFPFVDSKNTANAIHQRMHLFHENAAGQPIQAYINVGGGAASIGLRQLPKQVIKSDKPMEYHSLPTGVNESLPINLANTDSVATRFLKDGVPVINIRDVVQKMRVQYDLPRSPRFSPVIGWGPIFFSEEYNAWLTFIVLVVIVTLLTLLAILSRRYLIRYVQPRE